MTTISKLGKKYGLSRSTLLYYDKIGVLSPAGRTGAGYRSYSASDANRLEKIRNYRNAGLSLDAVKRTLDGPSSALGTALEKRLKDLAQEMDTLQAQQDLICTLLKRDLPKTRKGLTKDTWTTLLVASGFSDDDMRGWHAAFEANAPEKHQAFLEFLSISKAEIRKIRRWSASSLAVDLGDRTQFDPL